MIRELKWVLLLTSIVLVSGCVDTLIAGDDEDDFDPSDVTISYFAGNGTATYDLLGTDETITLDINLPRAVKLSKHNEVRDAGNCEVFDVSVPETDFVQDSEGIYREGILRSWEYDIDDALDDCNDSL